MEIKPIWFTSGCIQKKGSQTFFAMRLLLVLLLLSTLTAPAQKIGEGIDLRFTNASLETIFKEIKKQSGYTFIYTREQLQQSRPVTINVQSATIESVLVTCFKNQPFTYIRDGKQVVLRDKATTDTSQLPRPEVSGLVQDENGLPLPGSTVTLKGTRTATTTDSKGFFHLTGLPENAVLQVSAVGHLTREIAVAQRRFIEVTLAPAISKLDEAIIIAYGTTTRRLSTGSVSKVSAQDIARQPVTNPLAALQGRVAGLFITQSSGLPGSNFSVQVRGQNSLKQGNQPLYIIDGVPFMLNSGTLSQISISDINHPLNTINPADIESIEVLKDADATAIYGSQGANGVILITTKKGRSGKTKLDLSYTTGISQATRTLKLLDTKAYVAMRKEAFANDGIAPTPSTAPDLLLWDTAAYTNWTKALIGGTGTHHSVQLSLTGGSASTQFLVNGNYNRETTVFPFDKPSQRGTGRLQVNHVSTDRKFKAAFVSTYSVDTRKLTYNDLTAYTFLPPNTPAAYDPSGALTWTNWVSGVDNPYALQYTQYESEVDNLMGNAVLEYQLFNSLSLKLNAGYNQLSLQEETQVPIQAQRPSSITMGSRSLAQNSVRGLLLEPQVSYFKKMGNAEISLLSGLSLQRRLQKGSRIGASGYTSDDLLGTLSAAGQLTATNSATEYRYLAAFSRLQLQWMKKYILNLNARRDGSSRFGPANQFSSFGSAGAAWIFSEEKSVKDLLPFLSFGKLRGSYGVTGNDQIGDYQYLDGWSSSPVYTYQQQPGILPNRLFNAYYGWERNKKLEVALDLGLLNNRLLFSTAYYRNRSDNQLVNHKLPATTGFTTILRNLDALIQNTGVELELTSRNLVRPSLEWSTSFNITIPRNKLLAYPGLELSTDKNNYVIGAPINILKQYHYTGINPQTGVYQFEDINSDGIINATDLATVSFLGQRYYGGLSNEVKYKNIQFSAFFQFVRQQGRNYLSSLLTVPGNLGNQPAYIEDRWRSSGDKASVQYYTASASAAALAFSQFKNADGTISDASFLRLKNIALSYSVPAPVLTRLKLSQLRVYVQGQNLLTLTRYQGADPENQTLTALPLLKMYAAGIQLTF